MELTHEPLIYLFDSVLDNDIQKCINDFISLEVEQKEKYETDKLWIVDQKIGGIGDYAMPSNPIVNPFPGGIERSFYRPLQYARCNIDIRDIRFRARYIVQSCCMYLETVCRLVLKRYKVFRDLRFYTRIIEGYL